MLFKITNTTRQFAACYTGAALHHMYSAVYSVLQGSWQIPLHMTGPSREDPTFHGASLKDAPRVPCSSLLIRILSIAAARAAMRRKIPAYADRSGLQALLAPAMQCGLDMSNMLIAPQHPAYADRSGLQALLLPAMQFGPDICHMLSVPVSLQAGRNGHAMLVICTALECKVYHCSCMLSSCLSAINMGAPAHKGTLSQIS